MSEEEDPAQLSVLNRHDKNMLVRRLPHAVRAMLEREGPKVVVAGGFIRSVITGEKVNDVDLFSCDKVTAELLARRLADKTKGRVIETDNAYTIVGTGVTVQFIHRWTFREVPALLASFDFTIARAAIWCRHETAAGMRPVWDTACDMGFYEDLAGRRLIYRCPQRDEEAGGSMLRILKFYQRGYRIPLDSLAKVTARLVLGISGDRLEKIARTHDEADLAKILAGLLYEVDPNIDAESEAFLPSGDAPAVPAAAAAEGGAA